MQAAERTHVPKPENTGAVCDDGNTSFFSPRPIAQNLTDFALVFNGDVLRGHFVRQ